MNRLSPTKHLSNRALAAVARATPGTLSNAQLSYIEA